MKFFLTLSLFVLLILPAVQAQQNTPKEEIIREIYSEALKTNEAYSMLRELTKGIGHRLSGSPQAAAAVEWARQKMQTYGFDTVWLQPVMVPHWVRGKAASAQILSAVSGNKPLQVIALGNSVGTGADGLSAEVIEVSSFEELEALNEKDVAGKIVFFNAVMNPEHINTFQAYSETARYRTAGPAAAAKKGAIAALVRSLTPGHDHVPHTGTTRYDENGKAIPSLAVSTLDADLLSRRLKNDPELKVYLESYGEMLGEVLSYNVIGEIRGSEKPDQVLLVGGHLDSWDVGEGAHDDGAGCVQSIDALRILKEVGYQPRHSLRAVMFMNEENGLRGGRKYAEVASESDVTHLAAIESDAGGFSPIGFSIDSDIVTLSGIKAWKPYFAPYQLHQIEAGYGGADISPLKNQGVTLISLRPDSQRYFDYHHTAEDTFEKVSPRELALGTAAMASLLYLLDQQESQNTGSN